jgi:predicted DNA-binding transcriptional regulator YafY
MLEVELPTGDVEQIARLLLRLGADAAVVAPSALADRVRALAEQALAAYDPA